MPNYVSAGDGSSFSIDGKPLEQVEDVGQIAQTKNYFKDWIQDDQNAILILERINDSTVARSVGAGSFGTVKRLKLSNGQKVAIKKMSLSIVPDNVTSDRQIIESQRAEYEILASARNPFIVEYFRFYLDFNANLLFVFMEYCENQSLRQRKFEQCEIPTLFAQACLGLESLHNKNIFHRDIKPDNILLTRGGVVKIADFGCAKIVDMQTSNAKSLRGTLGYMAPEVFKAYQAEKNKQPYELTYSNKVDIWSLGCVLCFLLDGRDPVVPSDDILQGQSHPLPAVALMTNALRDLLQHMLKINADDRPYISEVLQNEYLDDALVYIHQRFPPVPDESSQVIHYVPEIDMANNDEHQWARMKPVQTYADGRISLIDFSTFPRDNSEFSWIFQLWSRMVKGEFEENMEIYLPPVRLPSESEIGGCLVDIKLVRRYTKNRSNANLPEQPSHIPSRDLRMFAKYSPYPRNPEMVPFPLKCICNLTIHCSENDKREKPPTSVELTSRAEHSLWFIFHEFKWSTLDANKPPSLSISFVPE